MYRQAAIIALDETLRNIDSFKFSHTGVSSVAAGSLQARTITGINIAKRLLEESGPKEDCEVHIFQMDASEMPEPFKTMIGRLLQEAPRLTKCPRCGNEEISPGAKFCKICGMALMADKGAE